MAIIGRISNSAEAARQDSSIEAQQAKLEEHKYIACWSIH
jgi:hypothetical protein